MVLVWDTPDLDIMARDQLMLSPKPRLMLDFSMEDMDMVSQLMDTLDLDITARDLLMLSLRLTLDIFIVDMDILIMVNLYLPSCLKQKLKAISDWQCNIQCPGMKGRNCFELINKSDHNRK